MIQNSINQALAAAGVVAGYKSYMQRGAMSDLKGLGEAPEGIMQAYEQDDPNLAQKMTEAQAKIQEQQRLLKMSGKYGKQYMKQGVLEGENAGYNRAEAWSNAQAELDEVRRLQAMSRAAQGAQVKQSQAQNFQQ